MFDLHGNERLTYWKDFRDSLETSNTPLEDVAMLWSRAPFVSPFLNPKTPKSWPDPWHLILDNKLDELAITIGMLYTVKLTERFIDSVYEIHMSIPEKNQEPNYFLIIDNQFILNAEPRKVLVVGELNTDSKIIWTGRSL